MTNDEARKAARGLAAARIGLGVVAFVFPSVPGKPWIGQEATRPGARLFARALGARDAALGLGLLLADRHDRPIRGWLEAGGLADAGDVLATLIGWKAAAPRTRWLVLAAAGGGVASARVLSPLVD